MSKPRFTALTAGFLEQNRRVESGEAGGSFPVIAAGVYDVKINKCHYKQNESGSEQVSIGFQINSDAEEFANQIIFWNQTLVNKDGELNEIGSISVINMLNSLSQGQFDAAEFSIDPDEALEKFMDISCKIKVVPKTSGKYTNYTIDLLSVYNDKDNSLAYTDESNSDKTEAEVSIGDKVEYNGEECVIQNFVGTEEDGIILIKSCSTGQLYQAKPEDCSTSGNKQEEKEMEMEISDPEIIVGSMVTSIFNGKEFNGKVHKILEDEGKINIEFNGKLRQCLISDTVTEVPF